MSLRQLSNNPQGKRAVNCSEIVPALDLQVFCDIVYFIMLKIHKQYLFFSMPAARYIDFQTVFNKFGSLSVCLSVYLHACLIVA